MSSLLTVFQYKDYRSTGRSTSGTGTVQLVYGNSMYQVGFNGRSIACRYVGSENIPMGSLVLLSQASTGQWFIMSAIGTVASTERQEVIIDG